MMIAPTAATAWNVMFSFIESNELYIKKNNIQCNYTKSISFNSFLAATPLEAFRSTWGVEGAIP